MTTASTTRQDEPVVWPTMDTVCMGKLNKRAWHSTIAVQVADVLFGVRANTRQTADVLARTLAPLRQSARDADVAPNFSVELGDVDRGGRQLHIVYREHEVAARRRESGEAVSDLLALLDEIPMALSRERPVIGGGVLVGERGATIFPASMMTKVLTRRARLTEFRLQLMRSQINFLQPTGTAVLTRRCDDLLDNMLASRPSAEPSLKQAPITNWVVPGFGDESVQLSRPQGVFAAAGMIVNRHGYGMRRTLEVLADSAGRVSFHTLPDQSPARLVDTIIDPAK